VGWARLLPGTKMPATAVPSVGSAPVAADAQGLVATPTEVVAHYTDVLTNGDKSQFAATFAAPDTFRQRIESARAAQVSNAAIVSGGTFSETYTPLPGQTFALATADGGALVVASMATASSLTSKGATITVTADMAAVSNGTLATGAQLHNGQQATYSDVVAFYVPPAGAKGPVQVLGAEHIRTSVTGS